jgi:hypothetical protein
LGDAAFARDFAELYAYYKDARLLQLEVAGGKLLAAFQIGERSTDVRVFRWALSPLGEVTYIDARGDRDLVFPPPFDFEWTRAGREHTVSGRFPHLNVLDTLFVETTGGDLTIKVENNTETGEGIHREPVEEKTQSLDDAVFEFARLGSLILLKVLPYRETAWRGFVFNTLTGRVQRVDAITQACVQLPEDHGIIFPGGYYLQNGENKAFDARMDGMRFQRSVRSPNGEDVMYVFYEHEGGRAALFVYNLIQRKLQNPLFGHGHAVLRDGRMVLFHAEGDAPTRVHPMQIWQTPFVSPPGATACWSATPAACSTRTTGWTRPTAGAWPACCARSPPPARRCWTSSRRWRASAASRRRPWRRPAPTTPRSSAGSSRRTGRRSRSSWTR